MWQSDSRMSSACPGKHVALHLKVSLQGRNEMLDALAGCEIVGQCKAPT